MTNASDEGDNECAICQDVLKKPITLPCNHRYCSECLESWRCRHVLDKQKTCPQCRSKIPVTRSMISQLESFRRLRADLENKLRKSPCPLPALPGTTDYNYTKGFYGNIPDNEILRIRSLSPELQQSTLRSILESAHVHFDSQIRDLEEQIGDGIVLEECCKDKQDHEEELPPEIGIACENNDVQRVLDWLGNPPISSGRINAKNFKSNEMTLLHHATKGNRIGLIRLLLQHGADINAPTAMGLSSFLAACTLKRYQSAAMLFLEWGADKERRAPGPPGVGDVTAVDIAQNFAENQELVGLLRSCLGGRRCEIVGLSNHPRSHLNGRTCVAGMYFETTDEYAVRIDGNDDNGNGNDDNGNGNDDDDNGNGNGNGDESVNLRSENLKRRDRTPEDPGVVLEFCGCDPRTKTMQWKTKHPSHHQNSDDASRSRSRSLSRPRDTNLVNTPS